MRKKGFYTIEIFREGETFDGGPLSLGDFRWRLVAPNGRIVASSAEGYRREVTMARTITRFIDAIHTGKLEVTRKKP